MGRGCACAAVEAAASCPAAVPAAPMVHDRAAQARAVHRPGDRGIRGHPDVHVLLPVSGPAALGPTA